MHFFFFVLPSDEIYNNEGLTNNCDVIKESDGADSGTDEDGDCYSDNDEQSELPDKDVGSLTLDFVEDRVGCLGTETDSEKRGASLVTASSKTRRSQNRKEKQKHQGIYEDLFLW